MTNNKLRQIIREEISNLNESNMSGAIYHFTQAYNVAKILSTNSLRASQSYGEDKEEIHNKGRLNYISFTTIKSGKSGYPLQRKLPIRIAFDARKLGYNHKLVPVQWYSAENQVSWTKNLSTRQREDENEVRIVTDKTFIKDVSKYIKYIDIMIRLEEIALEPTRQEWLKRIDGYAEKLGIKVRYYTDNNDFLNGKGGSEDARNLVKGLTIPETDSLRRSGRRFNADKKPTIDGVELFVPYILLKIMDKKSMLNIFVKYVSENFEYCGDEKGDCSERSIRAKLDAEYKIFMSKIKQGHYDMEKAKRSWFHIPLVTPNLSTDSDDIFKRNIIQVIDSGRTPVINKTLYKFYHQRKKFVAKEFKAGVDIFTADTNFIIKYVLKK